LLRWLVAPGDSVSRGQAVAVVETTKGAIDIEIFHDGKIQQLVVPPGTRVPVGEVLAILEDSAAGESSAGIGPVESLLRQSEDAETAWARSEMDSVPPGERVHPRRRISPAARKRAEQLGVDLDTLRGTGPEGAVTSADVEQKAAAQRPLDGMRQTIAAAMARSKREIPHYYLSTRIDLEPALAWMEAENAKRQVRERLLQIALLAKATASALSDFPQLNGFWRQDGFEPAAGIHLGVAVALRRGGLVAPAIHGADTLCLDELMLAILDLVNRARSGGLRSSELSEPTITLTSLGELGVDCLYPIIYPPQVAIVGFGTPSPRPWVLDGNMVARRVVEATLAADHRASDGHLGGRFLRRIDKLLGEPEKL